VRRALARGRDRRWRKGVSHLRLVHQAPSGGTKAGEDPAIIKVDNVISMNSRQGGQKRSFGSASKKTLMAVAF
jgi:hypothetical protein